jgi:ubiquinone/menaquinone biosynthesis C-methylase UbiE
MLLQELCDKLRCPDDGSKLIMEEEDIKCRKCGRVFYILSENTIEILPNTQYPLDTTKLRKEYLATYKYLFQKKFEWDPTAKGWEIPTHLVGGQAYVLKKRELVEKFLGETLNGILCDVSGGAGSYSLHFAKIANMVIHCDLDVKSINGVCEQIKQKSLRKIVIIRCDHLQMPFASNTFDSIICLGSTTGNGTPYDERLLAEIIRCLKPHGRFVIDYPNKSRMPLILSSLLPHESTNLFAYDEDMLKKVFKDINHKIVKIGYVPVKLVPFLNAYTFLDKISQIFRIPPSTFIVFGQKG